jgi:hypothetical protein
MVGNTISAGRFASEGGDCININLSPLASGLFGLPGAQSFDNVCGYKIGVGYDSAPEIQVLTLRLVDRAGRDCSLVSTFGNAAPRRDLLTADVRVPPSLGGTLYVTFALRSALGGELATRSFTLPGPDGCNAFNP